MADSGVIERPPVLGFADFDNDYRQRQTLVASLSLDADPSGVSLSGGAVFTSVPGEVISGARSVKLVGPNASVEIDPGALLLQGGTIYALEYDYRVMDGAGAESVVWVLGRWGPLSELHGDPWGLPVSAFGEEGTQRRQFLFGEGGYPTFLLATDEAVTVVVDNLRVWRLDSEAARSTPPIFSFGFPRLGNYAYGSPYSAALYNGVDAAGIEDVLGRYDLVNGVQIDNTLGDTGWAERIRARNPAIQVLPYRLSYSAQNLDVSEPVGGTSGLEGLFNRAVPEEWVLRGPDGQPLKDQIFAGNTQLDPTMFCTRVDGVVFAEFMESFIGDTVLPSGLWDGIHFDQAEWFPNPLLAETINGPLPPIDLDRDGAADPNPMLFSEFRVAFDRYFYLMRRRFGSSRLLYGNPGRIPLNSGVVASLNGWQEEIFSPYEILPNGDWSAARSAAWHDFVRNYLNASEKTRAPQALNVQSTGRGLGVPNGLPTGHGYANREPAPEQRDYQRMRLGLATTLLGNGFFGYDFVDNTTPPAWFDEYAIDATGHPTTDLSGKGYLGQPLGAAQEIVRPATVVMETGFEEEVPEGLSLGEGAFFTHESWQVIEGAASMVIESLSAADSIVFATDPNVIPLTPGTSYDLVVKFRVLDYQPQSFASFLAMGIGPATGAVDFFGRAYAYHQDVEGLGQTITMRTQVKVSQPGEFAYALLADQGTIAMDSFRLTEVAGGAFRRDFEGGVALVNPTPEPITLTQNEVAGPLGRTGLRRIHGVQDPVTNSGAAVTAGITIAPADGIILMADTLPAPAPIAPTTVVAVPGETDPVADLFWDTPAGGTRAGHYIEYKVADGSTWGRFELAGPSGAHRMESLDPGTTYDVRVAAFDFAGRISGFTAPVSFTTAGAAPARAHIDSIQPMVRGRFAEMTGASFSEFGQDLSGTLPYEYLGTSVRVNGVPARLAFVLPWSIVFAVPDTVALGDAVVRVYRDGIGSAGFAATVLAPDPPVCAGDVSGDGVTNAADFNVLASHFGQFVPIRTRGDVTGDGFVNAADFNVVAGGFGCGAP